MNNCTNYTSNARATGTRPGTT